jgi:hypothetical protein
LAHDSGGAATALNERDQVVGLSCKLEVIPHVGLTDYVWHCRAVLWTTKGGSR